MKQNYPTTEKGKRNLIGQLENQLEGLSLKRVRVDAELYKVTRKITTLEEISKNLSINSKELQNEELRVKRELQELKSLEVTSREKVEINLSPREKLFRDFPNLKDLDDSLIPPALLQKYGII